MPDSTSSEMTLVRLSVGAGDGRLARSGSALLFVPEQIDASPSAVDALVGRFLDKRTALNGPDDDRTFDPVDDTAYLLESTVAFAVIDWSSLTSTPTNAWTAGSSVRVTARGKVFVHVEHADHVLPNRVDEITDSLIDLSGRRSATVSLETTDAATEHPESTSGAATDLIAGVVPAGSIVLDLNARHTASAMPGRSWFESPTDVAPPQFDEVGRGDDTADSGGSVSWPDEPARNDSTLRRPDPTPRTSTLAVELPNGSVVPVIEPIVVGREPDIATARTIPRARLVPVEAPSTVSRTHVVISPHPDGNSDELTVIDCNSRGRTAIVHSDDTDPTALTAWEPASARIGDRILLGGPTALSIVAGSPASNTPANDDVTLLPPSQSTNGTP